MNIATTITKKGQITLPEWVRTQFNLKPGNRVLFEVGDDIKIKKAPSTHDMYGFIKTDKKLSVEDMDNAITRARNKRLKK